MEENWSVRFEDEMYENDLKSVINGAIHAVEMTSKGFYVNLFTPSNFDDPNQHLIKALDLYFGNKIDLQFFDESFHGSNGIRVWRSK